MSVVRGRCQLYRRHRAWSGNTQLAGGRQQQAVMKTRHSGMTRPPRLKAKPMAGRHGDAEKRRDGKGKVSKQRTAGGFERFKPRITDYGQLTIDIENNSLTS
ncbi:MAG: hypothetical protein C0610_15195 [Desulfobacteraceae bacterium]|nr:MAG: hypothetical protein C0610_15195 [Desulfobacteraceae bacterium]